MRSFVVAHVDLPRGESNACRFHQSSSLISDKKNLSFVKASQIVLLWYLFCVMNLLAVFVKCLQKWICKGLTCDDFLEGNFDAFDLFWFWKKNVLKFCLKRLWILSTFSSVKMTWLGISCIGYKFLRDPVKFRFFAFII